MCYNNDMNDLKQTTIATDSTGTFKLRGFYRAEDSAVKDTEGFKMPARATLKSAGYDLFNNTGADIVLQPNQTCDKISTGIVAYMLDDEVFKVYGRSGHGFKYSVRLANSTGIIDADYLKEIFIKIRNPNNYQVIIPKGESFAQGIFSKYLLADNDADTVGGERTGGLGSTSSK